MIRFFMTWFVPFFVSGTAVAQELTPEQLVQKITALAAKKGCTPAQLALAWVLAQGNDIVPIPGTKRRQYLEENVGALGIRLTPEELAEIDSLIPPGAAAGSRYSEPGMKAINR